MGLTTDQIILLQPSSFLTPLSDQKYNKGKSRSFTTLTRFCSVYCCHSSFEKRNYHHTSKETFFCAYILFEKFFWVVNLPVFQVKLFTRLCPKAFLGKISRQYASFSSEVFTCILCQTASQILYSQCSL